MSTPAAPPPARAARLQGRPGSSRRRRLRGRFRRRSLLLAVLVVALVSGLLLVGLGSRPSASAESAVPVEAAYVGTTYGFDELVCLGAQVLSARVEGVRVRQGEGSTTRLVRAPDAPPTLGFPVPDGGAALDGLTVAPGEQDCTTRLLVTPTRKGAVRAGTLRVRLAYGPGRLLHRTVAVTPQVSLDVTGTGRDPRSG